MKRIMRLAAAASAVAALPVLGLANANASTADTIRLSGADRFGTSAAVSVHITNIHKAMGVSDGHEVVLASSKNFPDGLTAGVAAAYGHNRILLVPPTGPIPTTVKNELVRLGIKGAVVVGGSDAIGNDVENEIKAMGIITTRAAGVDRFGTAATIAAMAANANTMLIANGMAYPDALSASAAGLALRGPLVLTMPSYLPPATVAAVKYTQATNFIVIGGTASVNDSVITQIKQIKPGATVTRVAGADRYQTAAAVSRKAHPYGAKTVYFASSATFADAVSAGPAAAQEDGPLLLATKDCVPLATMAEITRLQTFGPVAFRVVGGTGVLSANIVNRVACTW